MMGWIPVSQLELRYGEVVCSFNIILCSTTGSYSRSSSSIISLARVEINLTRVHWIFCTLSKSAPISCSQIKIYFLILCGFKFIKCEIGSQLKKVRLINCLGVVFCLPGVTWQGFEVGCICSALSSCSLPLPCVLWWAGGGIPTHCWDFFVPPR